MCIILLHINFVFKRRVNSLIMFELDKKLQNDSIKIDSLQLCDLLLMNDSKYPWFILVPRINDIIEILDLDDGSQKILLDEINYVSNFLKNDFKCDKLNIATLGNVVKQFHVHVIARFTDDHSFPNPVWCNNVAKEYEQSQIDKIIEKYNEFKQGN